MSGARQNGLDEKEGLTWRKEIRKQRVGNVGTEVGGSLVAEHKTSKLHRPQACRLQDTVIKNKYS